MPASSCGLTRAPRLNEDLGKQQSRLAQLPSSVVCGQHHLVQPSSGTAGIHVNHYIIMIHRLATHQTDSQTKRRADQISPQQKRKQVVVESC